MHNPLKIFLHNFCFLLHPHQLIKSTISPADHSFIDIHVTCAILYSFNLHNSMWRLEGEMFI